MAQAAMQRQAGVLAQDDIGAAQMDDDDLAPAPESSDEGDAPGETGDDA